MIAFSVNKKFLVDPCLEVISTCHLATWISAKQLFMSYYIGNKVFDRKGPRGIDVGNY